MSEVEDETLGFEVGGIDYITKPVSPSVVKARVNTHLSLYNNKRLLEEEVKVRTHDLEKTRFEIIRRLGRAAEYKDNETGLHVIRMSQYSKLLARQIGMSDSYCDTIYHAAAMHDVGKIGTPDSILKKPGKLDEDEWEIMKQHAATGAEIIGHHEDPLLNMARNIALTHHERWDGSGYPNQLKGEQIPLEGRIGAIADVFDALTSDRPYKKAWSVDKAIDLIESESGKQFDPNLVFHFKKILDEVMDIRNMYLEEL